MGDVPASPLLLGQALQVEGAAEGPPEAPSQGWLLLEHLATLLLPLWLMGGPQGFWDSAWQELPHGRGNGSLSHGFCSGERGEQVGRWASTGVLRVALACLSGQFSVVAGTPLLLCCPALGSLTASGLLHTEASLGSLTERRLTGRRHVGLQDRQGGTPFSAPGELQPTLPPHCFPKGSAWLAGPQPLL